ncbi:MAG: hypothetical protein AAGF95_20140 [Chloroflexota bacterium]
MPITITVHRWMRFCIPFIVLGLSSITALFTGQSYAQDSPLLSPPMDAKTFRISSTGREVQVNTSAIIYNNIVDEYFVVWSGTRRDDETSEIYSRRMSVDGQVIGTDDARISTMGPDGDGGYLAGSPHGAYNDTANEYMIVWAGNDTEDRVWEIYGQRLNAVGQEIGSDDFRISILEPEEAVAYAGIQPRVTYNSDANEYLVVWTGLKGLSIMSDEVDIYGQRLDATGQLIGPRSFRISDMAPDGFGIEPDVNYNGVSDEYMVVWAGRNNGRDVNIHGQRLNAVGQEIGPNDFRISDSVPAPEDENDRSPKLAHNQTTNEYLVVWERNMAFVGAEIEIYGRRLDAAGQSMGLRDVRISDMGPEGNDEYDALDPKVTYNEIVNEYLVVWDGEDVHTDGTEINDIYGQRLTERGQEIGLNDFRISDMGSSGYSSFANVVYHSVRNEYLVTWTGSYTDFSDNEIYGQRLTTEDVRRWYSVHLPFIQ